MYKVHIHIRIPTILFGTRTIKSTVFSAVTVKLWRREGGSSIVNERTRWREGHTAHIMSAQEGGRERERRGDGKPAGGEMLDVV